MNIPTSLIVVLLVVAWLVVLVPMVARRREKVPQEESAGTGFRVLRRAQASLRRRPGRGAKGPTVTDPEQRSDDRPVADTEALVTVGGAAERAGAHPADAAEEWAAAQAAYARRASARPAEPPTEAAAPVDFGDYDPALATEADQDLEFADQDTRYIERYEEPTRIGTPEPALEQARVRRPVPDEVNEEEWAEHVAAAPAGGAYEVDDEQLRPVPQRRGRGGFDPEAAEATRAFRYKQRRRITLILLVATVAFSVLAALVFSWLWVGALVSLGLLVGYLAYLRRQVRIEAAIRQKRMERLQRARQIRPEYARAPRRTRGGMSAVQPGRSIVDLDDDDPGFDDLDEYQEHVNYRRAAGQ